MTNIKKTPPIMITFSDIKTAIGANNKNLDTLISIFNSKDKNHNGVLEKTEYQEFHTELKNMANSIKPDGKISKDEVKQAGSEYDAEFLTKVYTALNSLADGSATPLNKVGYTQFGSKMNEKEQKLYTRLENIDKYGFDPEYNQDNQVDFDGNITLTNANGEQKTVNLGIKHKGDEYNVKQNGNDIIVKNKSTNKEITINLDKLLSDIKNEEDKKRIIGALQNLPGEVLVDLDAEINKINISSLGNAEGEYNSSDEAITLDNSIIKDQEKLIATLTHEIGHAIDSLPFKSSSYSNKHIRQLVGEDGTFTKEQAEIIKEIGEYSIYDNTKGTKYHKLYNTPVQTKKGVDDNGREYTNTSYEEDAYSGYNKDENFAEFYKTIMLNGKNHRSARILSKFIKTNEINIKYIDEVRNLNTPRKD